MILMTWPPSIPSMVGQWYADGSLLYVGLLNEHGQPHGFGVGTSATFGLAGVWADGKHVK